MNVKKIQLKKLASVLLIMAMLFSAISTVGLADDLPEGTAFKATFEDDEKQLGSAGGASLAIVEGGFNSGNCLEVSGRTVTYAGASIDLTDDEIFAPNTTYILRAKAMYKEGPDTLTLNATHSYTPTYRGRNYFPVANVTLQRGVWNYFEGVFFLEGNTQTPNVYFQMPNSKVATFYLDDVEIVKVVVTNDTIKIGSETKKIIPTPTPKAYYLDPAIPGNLIVNGNFNKNSVTGWTTNQTWNTNVKPVWQDGELVLERPNTAYDLLYDITSLVDVGSYTLSGKIKLPTGLSEIAKVYTIYANVNANGSWSLDFGKVQWAPQLSVPGNDFVPFSTTVSFTAKPDPAVNKIFVAVRVDDKAYPDHSSIVVDNFALVKLP